MARKKKVEYNLKLAVVARFFRTWVPQAVLFFPILIANADKINEILPFWVIPVLTFFAAVLTALDKLFREIKFYDRIKTTFVNS